MINEQYYGNAMAPIHRTHALESELQHARHSLEAQRVGIEALRKERDALKEELSGDPLYQSPLFGDTDPNDFWITACSNVQIGCILDEIASLPFSVDAGAHMLQIDVWQGGFGPSGMIAQIVTHPAPVPEPATYGLVGGALGVVGLWRRKRA